MSDLQVSDLQVSDLPVIKAIVLLDKVLAKISFAILAVCLALMLLLTLVNIAARWFETTFIWIDPLVRHLVFLSAFMGGALATGKGSHIKIDVASRALEAADKKGFEKALAVFIGLVCGVACFFLVKAGVDFAKIEFEWGREAFLGIHSGVLVSVIPFGFALIGVRFVTNVFIKLSETIAGQAKLKNN